MAKYFRLQSQYSGQAVLLKGAPYTVIGVLPEGAITPLNADIYTALQLGPEGEGGGTNLRPSPGCAMAPPGSRRMPKSTAPGPTVPIAMS